MAALTGNPSGDVNSQGQSCGIAQWDGHVGGDGVEPAVGDSRVPE